MTAVFDTSLVVDYLRGVKRAQAAFARFPDRAITVVTWVEVMGDAPPRLEAQTREFLRSFERLAINEAIADRALALKHQHSGMSLRHTIPWATAQVNSCTYVTADFPRASIEDVTVCVPYRTAR